MPTALDAGRYSSKGFHPSRQRQYVRATGFPLPSTWASAASKSGVMTAVECSWKSGPYRRQVSPGGLAREPLTGKNSSVGLRITWTIQFTADKAARRRAAPTTMRIATGRASSARSARRADRQRDRPRAGCRRRTRVLRGVPRAVVAGAMNVMRSVCRRLDAAFWSLQPRQRDLEHAHRAGGPLPLQEDGTLVHPLHRAQAAVTALGHQQADGPPDAE